MAEIATLARPYAKAVFELAKSQARLGPWGDMLALLAAVASQPLVEQLLDLGEHRIDRQSRGVDQDSTIGLEQRTVGSGAVESVTRLDRRLDNLVDRTAHNTRHGGDFLDHAFTTAHKNRPDKIRRRQIVLTHQATDAFVLAQAAQAGGGVGGLDRVHRTCPLKRCTLKLT